MSSLLVHVIGVLQYTRISDNNLLLAGKETVKCTCKENNRYSTLNFPADKIALVVGLAHHRISNVLRGGVLCLSFSLSLLLSLSLSFSVWLGQSRQ